MRGLAAAIVWAVVAAAQTYPPPFPRHGATKLFDNSRVQVWNVFWPKGQVTALHRHPYDMTGIYYAPGDRIITAVDGSKRPVSTKAGGIIWQFKGLTHIEEGTSDAPLRAVMIELKEAAALNASHQPSEMPDFAVTTMPMLDNERVTVWDYTPSAVATRHQHRSDAVVVWIEGATPHATFVAGGTTHDRENTGAARSATVFELK